MRILQVRRGGGVTQPANPAETRMKNATEKVLATYVASENSAACTGRGLEESVILLLVLPSSLRRRLDPLAATATFLATTRLTRPRNRSKRATPLRIRIHPGLER